ncbi:DNA repair protein RadA [Paraliomyxa miuraensis]|uniref:DNA repair protein RadA n=1 Tax=Paraliomyxa miuraensis TaxID=376150 RepID=UPI002258889C|nr:DNA repair protein RadA [Paraliomyxa miuraensis]MCX4247368.1 DNA repair protein RadA [Paraliomyxa miuraensis]
MAKAKSSKPKRQWVCSACAAVSSQWFGQCPDCRAWNTLEEQIEAPVGDGRVVLSQRPAAPIPVTRADEIDEGPRRSCGIGEVDRVLGGGLVPGSVVLVGGPPGIGKSTLLLQVSAALARSVGPVLYASGEESVAQVAGRATRLEATHERLLLLAETVVESVLSAARGLRPSPAVLVIDSIQTIYSEAHQGLPGNVTQIRAVSTQLVSYAKSAGVPVIVVGHVTKDGQLAGPKLLEHMVDAVVAFEGDEDRSTRLLRATKNRFGSTQELGVFEMTGQGLRPIDNPSEALLAERPAAAPGSCVTASLEGSRPLLLEVQALLAQSMGGSPRRNCVGVDPSRLAMLMAVLDRHGDMFVLDQDVFMNVAGGLRLFEPASDLAVLMAVASSHMRRPLPPELVAVGEIGLTGEIRQATRIELRLAEAARLGFRRALVAKRRDQRKTTGVPEGLELCEVSNVREALEVGLGR